MIHVRKRHQRNKSRLAEDERLEHHIARSFDILRRAKAHDVIERTQRWKDSRRQQANAVLLRRKLSVDTVVKWEYMYVEKNVNKFKD